MDTRSKILSASALAAISERPLLVITGYFDVLRAAHAREIRQAGERAGAARVIVVVMPRAGELLTVRARAEMVAALRLVDHVVIGPASFPAGASVIHLEEADEGRLRELRRDIVSRARVQ